MEWSPSGATPSVSGDGVEWEGGRLRVCERRSLKTEQWRMAYAHWSDPATFPTGDQLPPHYRAMALPGRKWESVRRYGCMKAIDLESYSKWPESQDRVRETMRAWRAENDSAELVEARGAMRPKHVVELLGDLVDDVIASTARLPDALPRAVELRILTCLDWRELSFVVAAGGLVPVASAATSRALLRRVDFTVPLASVNQREETKGGFGWRWDREAPQVHHFGALDWPGEHVHGVGARKTANVYFWKNVDAANAWIEALRDDPMLEDHSLTSRETTAGSLTLYADYERLVTIEPAAAPDRALASLLESLVAGAYNHGCVETCPFELSYYDSKKRNGIMDIYVRPEKAPMRKEYKYKYDYGRDQNETAVLVSLPAADRVTAGNTRRVLFVVHELECCESEECIEEIGSLGFRVSAVLPSARLEAVHDVHANERSRLGQLPKEILDIVLRFAGDRRHGLDQHLKKIRHRRERELDDDDFLGPHDHVTLLQVAIGSHTDGRECFCLKTPSGEEAARVAEALKIEPSRLGAVVRLVLLLANVRGHGVGQWNAVEAAHAAPRNMHRMTILDLLREGFALERVDEEDRGSSVLVRGAAAVAAYPAVSRPDELTDDTSSPRDRDMGFSYPHMDWSPCGLRDELELVLARQLPRADAFDHLPRLITSLRGMRQKVEDRVDIQGDFSSMLTTAVDEMTSKLEKYWKSGEDDEDYYEQDDDCRGADYYWEQHEDCDY